MTKRSDGRWVETVTLPNGKRKYIYGKSKTDVLIKMNALLDKTYNPLFGDVAEEWFSSWEKSVQWKTYNAYITTYKTMIEHFGKMRIAEISPLDVQLFLQAKKDDGYSATYVKRYKTLLSKVFSWEILKRGGVIKTDPTKEAKMPKFERRKVHSATVAQEDTIRELVNEPFGLYAFLLLHTGCRSGEALALQWKDVDFDAGVIHIYKSVVFEPSGTKVKEPKTPNSVRDVPILQPLRIELDKIKTRPKEYYLFGGKQPLLQREYYQLWRTYAVKAGFWKDTYYKSSEGHKLRKRTTHLTPHQLRHSFATMCLEAELSPEDAQHILGHADIQTTVNVYTDIREEKMNAAYAKLNAFLAKK